MASGSRSASAAGPGETLIDMATPPTLLARAARRARSDRGATSIEYATVLLLIAIVIVFSLAAGVDGMLEGVAGKIAGSVP
jgi:Flp pilus assembly pilin Flp